MLCPLLPPPCCLARTRSGLDFTAVEMNATCMPCHALQSLASLPHPCKPSAKPLSRLHPCPACTFSPLHPCTHHSELGFTMVEVNASDSRSKADTKVGQTGLCVFECVCVWVGEQESLTRGYMEIERV